MSRRTSGLRRHLTPSLVISLIALVVATSGTAVAARVLTGADIRNGSITSADIRNNTLVSADVKNGSLAFNDLNNGAKKKLTETPAWAIVDSDGTLLRGNHVVSSVRDVDGFYFVQFAYDVSDRPVSVTPLNTGIGETQVTFRYCGNNPGGLINGCTIGDEDPSFVFVNTENSAGSNVDAAFLVTAGLAGTSVDTPHARSAHRGAGVEGR